MLDKTDVVRLHFRAQGYRHTFCPGEGSRCSCFLSADLRPNGKLLVCPKTMC